MTCQLWLRADKLYLTVKFYAILINPLNQLKTIKFILRGYYESRQQI